MQEVFEKSAVHISFVCLLFVVFLLSFRFYFFTNFFFFFLFSYFFFLSILKDCLQDLRTNSNFEVLPHLLEENQTSTLRFSQTENPHEIKRARIFRKSTVHIIFFLLFLFFFFDFYFFTNFFFFFLLPYFFFSYSFFSFSFF